MVEEGNFKPRECLKVIQNLFAPPKYETLKMRSKAYIKLMCYCYLAGDQEITGLGRIKDGEIVDFKIPYQEVGGATADATDEAMIDLMREIPIDEIKEWELDWHSHVNMSVTPSATDWENYELMSMARGGNQFPLMIVNKKGEFTLKNYITEDKHPNIALNVQLDKISNATIEKIYNSCKEEVAEKLSMRKIKNVFKNGNVYNYDGYHYGNRYGSSLKGTARSYSMGLCQSCGEPLLSADELENGLCDDCLAAWCSSEK